MPFTADGLLESIKRGITVPESQVRFSDADILALADEEIQTEFVPMIQGLREEFFVKIKTIPIVADQKYYAIPYRAVGRMTRDIRYIDSSNQTYLLSLISPEDELYFTNQNVSGAPTGFFFQEDKIALIPTPASSVGNLQVKYLLRPNKLTQLANVGVITAINTGTGVVTLSSALTGLTTSTQIDFIQAKAGNVTLSYDVTPTNVASTLVTFDTDDLPDDLVVGDYVSFAGYTPVVQLPEEAHPVLANAVQCRMLRGLGDYEGLAAEEANLTQKKIYLRDVLCPRDEAHPPVIIQRRGFLRRGNIKRFSL